MSDEMRRAIETAFKMEQDSVDFYGEAAKKTTHALGRSMFESLVKDEQRHLQALGRLIRENVPSVSAEEILPMRGGTFKSEISTVFSQAREEIDERIPADADDLQALSLAMDLETKGHRFYGETAAKAENKAVRDVFLMLRREELEHFTFLQNAYQYLDKSGDWFLWEEQGILDGG
ncbi:MAG: ferritin family protein [Planctomycetes bacterium]|nr:ferritin family protein [Planctomycetota bacterium]